MVKPLFDCIGRVEPKISSLKIHFLCIRFSHAKIMLKTSPPFDGMKLTMLPSLYERITGYL